MTREEAIEWMQEEKASFERAPDLNGCPMTEYWQKAIDVYDMALSALRQQEHPNAPLTGWVSVKERLPEADVAVLARCFYNESWRTLVCHTSKRNAGEWYTNVTGQWVQVTNWMPLPEPPEKGTV